MDSNWQEHRLPTTRWSVISRVRVEDEEVAHEAYNEVSRIYWMPLYALARFKGCSPEDAEDGVQGFLMGLRERGFFEKVDREAGRLRAYFRKCFENYLMSESRKERREKRGGKSIHLSIDAELAENRLGDLEATGMDLTSFFDRQWVLALLRHVLGRVEENYAERGERELFDALSPHLRFDADQETTQEIAIKLGKTAGTVRQALCRLRARYRDAVKEEVRETVLSEDLAGKELAYLMGIFEG